MELILTGDQFTAQEAKEYNLVSRVVPADQLVDEAVKLAAKIGSLSKPIIQLAKESINQANETPLASGILFERRMFHATFGTKDQKNGMKAFTEKQKPQWEDA